MIHKASDPHVSVLHPAKAGRVYPDPGGSPLEVLERARLVLSPRNAWHKAGYTGTKHGVAARCSIQAINDCDGKHAEGAKKLFLKAAKELYPTRPTNSIPSFNDAGKTTKTDVLAVFDRAIELAQEG